MLALRRRRIIPAALSLGSHCAVILALLAFALLPAAPAANIAGKVSSLEGTAVPGAEITVQQNNSDFSTTIMTSEDGSYALPSLPFGVYTILVKKQGFAGVIVEL